MSGQEWEVISLVLQRRLNFFLLPDFPFVPSTNLSHCNSKG